MTVSAASFRVDFPEFADTGMFPDSLINFWLGWSNKFVNAQRWGSTVDLGYELFTAHNLVLEAKALATASAGGVPGAAEGVVSAKSVDKVSINYDVSASMEEGAGHWNLSIYGQRFIRLQRMMGTGGVQVGAGCSGSSASAWAGPNPFPWI